MNFEIDEDPKELREMLSNNHSQEMDHKARSVFLWLKKLFKKKMIKSKQRLQL